jgi:hypothetical protein
MGTLAPEARFGLQEWVAVIFPPVGICLLIAFAVAEIDGRRDWASFAIAIGACSLGAGVYSVVRVRRHGLLLRGQAVEESRSRITTVGIPFGWLLAAAGLGVSAAVGATGQVLLLAALAGAIFGFHPAILAGLIQQKREARTR